VISLHGFLKHNATIQPSKLRIAYRSKLPDQQPSPTVGVLNANISAKRTPHHYSLGHQCCNEPRQGARTLQSPLDIVRESDVVIVEGADGALIFPKLIKLPHDGPGQTSVLSRATLANEWSDLELRRGNGDVW
jgi:hypothetical protein